MKLLLADDSESLLKLVHTIFKDKDVRVKTVKDGEEAIKSIKKESPDIIIADTNMPKLNGYDLCKKIKKSKHYSRLPICLLHSEFDDFDFESFRSSGADDQLTKPFNAKDILNKVVELSCLIEKKKVKPIIYDNAHIIVINPYEKYQIATVSKVIN